MRSFLIFTFIFSFTSFSGCRPLNKGASSFAYELISKRKTFNVGGGQDAKYKVPTAKDCNDLVGKASSGVVEVSYMRGLDQTARCIADNVNETYVYVNNELGIQLNQKIRIYLHRLDSMPQSFEFHDKIEPNEYKFPIFVTPSWQTCSDALNKNQFYPMLIFHELTEMRISIAPSLDIPVLMDFDAGLFKIKNYTRWYREGLATYTAYIAYKHGLEKFSCDVKSVEYAPFSSLARVKTDLFRWHQFKDKPGYYDASFGLFIVLEHQYGRPAMRSLVVNMYKHKYMDGRDLIELVNNNFGIDIEKMVKEFEFPKLGFESTELNGSCPSQ